MIRFVVSGSQGEIKKGGRVWLFAGIYFSVLIIKPKGNFLSLACNIQHTAWCRWPFRNKGLVVLIKFAINSIFAIGNLIHDSAHAGIFLFCNKICIPVQFDKHIVVVFRKHRVALSGIWYDVKILKIGVHNRNRVGHAEYTEQVVQLLRSAQAIYGFNKIEKGGNFILNIALVAFGNNKFIHTHFVDVWEGCWF